MLRPVYACLVFCVSVAGSVRAQDLHRDSTHVLPGITVVDRREPFYGNEAAAYLTRISSRTLETSAGRTVADALGTHGGLFVRQYGAGGVGGVSIRGAGPSQVAVVLDGLPIASPQLGQVDLSLIPTFMLSGVEVLHGGASSLAGGGAMGGVVSLRSHEVPAGSSARLRSAFGAWGERSVSGQVTLGGRRVRALVAAEISRREGDFSYTDGASFPRTRKVRDNADGATDNLMARVVFSQSRSALEVAGWIMNSDRGLPGLAGSGSTEERQEDEVRRLWLRYLTGATTLTASTQRSMLTYVNPLLNVDDRGRTMSHSVGVQRRDQLGVGLGADYGVDLSFQSAAHPSLQEEVTQRSVRAFVSGSLTLGRLMVLPSLRGDWIARGDASVGQLSPGVRFRLQPHTGGSLFLWSGVSTSFRAPTFNDLYWTSAGAAGNPDLQPERASSIDVGADIEHRGMTLRVAAFYQAVRDQVTWLPFDTDFWRPENVGRVRVLGLESAASGSVTVADGVTLGISAGYILTDSRDRSDASSSSFGQPLRYVPAHVVHTDYSLRWRALEAGASVSRTSRRYVTTDGTDWLAPYSVVGGHVSARLETGLASLVVALHVENLGGTEYQIMSGYPMPPRHARFQLTLATK